MAQSGRKRFPLELHENIGNKHMGNEEKKRYKDSEVSLGNLKFTAPEYVKSNKIANEKWKEITKIYKKSGVKFVTSSDNGVLARYCLIYSEYLDLAEKRVFLSSYELPITKDELKKISKKEGVRNHEIWKLMSYMISTNGLIKLDSAINSKLKSLLEIEDRIFLNPVAKIRSIPLSKPKPEETDLEKFGFDI